jgi:hypothetical protein
MTGDEMIAKLQALTSRGGKVYTQVGMTAECDIEIDDDGDIAIGPFWDEDDVYDEDEESDDEDSDEDDEDEGDE